MMYPQMKFCIGPMSKTIVDAAIHYANEKQEELILIPSRRQVDWNGGYVGWTTEEFAAYVRSRSSRIRLERDHGGPGQGTYPDDGFESLRHDCKHFDIIHIDPWKAYPAFADGLEWTVKMIEFCYALNPQIRFEVGTEQGIRPFEVSELERLLFNLKDLLKPAVFERIEFVVIQCGTKLLEKENHGEFEGTKLTAMLDVVASYGKKAKEHNGDWVTMETVVQKEQLGLKYINIAPEMGEIETAAIMQQLTEEDRETFFQICLESGKWKKWVSSTFVPSEHKEQLTLICGHYVFTTQRFKDLVASYSINTWAPILRKITELNAARQRDACILCKKKDIVQVFERDFMTAISLSFYDTPYKNPVFIPYNVTVCEVCKTYQNKYVGDLSLIYQKNHVDAYGTVKQEMHDTFTEFLVAQKDIDGILEVGPSTDALARSVLSGSKIPYSVCDPDYRGDRAAVTVFDTFFEAIDLNNVQGNTIVMSNVFEHFYDPPSILDKIQKHSKNKYVFLNHPNFDFACKNDIPALLNVEHTFYIENSFVIDLFNKYGYSCTDHKDYSTHTVCFKFERTHQPTLTIPTNLTSTVDVPRFIANKFRKIAAVNELLDQYKVYIWPASSHTFDMFTFGLNYKKLAGLLDNSPAKIGKYSYGYDLQISDFKLMIASADESTCIVLGGSDCYIKELGAVETRAKVVYLRDF